MCVRARLHFHARDRRSVCMQLSACADSMLNGGGCAVPQWLTHLPIERPPIVLGSMEGAMAMLAAKCGSQRASDRSPAQEKTLLFRTGASGCQEVVGPSRCQRERRLSRCSPCPNGLLSLLLFRQDSPIGRRVEVVPPLCFCARRIAPSPPALSRQGCRHATSYSTIRLCAATCSPRCNTKMCTRSRPWSR